MTRRHIVTALLPVAVCAAGIACSEAAPTTAPPVAAAASAAVADVNASAKTTPVLIAYVSGRAGTTETDLYTMDVANGRSHAITRDRARAATPVWSPDGSQIAFASDRDALGSNIWIVPAAGGTPVKITQLGGTAPDWSADGAKIAFGTYRNGTTDIWVINADGTGETAITNTTDAWESEPVWSPDRTKIAYTSARSGETSQIWVMNADGSNPVQLTGLTNSGPSVSPAWSPDGTQIAFGSFRDGTQDLYVMNADGTGTTRITNGGPPEGRPRWSTRGIVFDANASGTPSIFVINPDGTGLTQLTRGSSWSYSGAWKPLR